MNDTNKAGILNRLYYIKKVITVDVLDNKRFLLADQVERVEKALEYLNKIIDKQEK